MNKQELMRVIKDYLLFNINYKDYHKNYYHFTPDNFYRPLRQWANIHKVSILAEVGQQAMIVMLGKFITAKDVQTILDNN